MKREFNSYIHIKNISFTVGFLLIFTAFGTNFSNAQKFIVAKDVVNQVRAKFKSFHSYKANFQIYNIQNKKTQIRTGTIYYRKPDKLHMSFSQPANQMVISDGKKLWIYLPSSKLLGEQSLSPENKDSFLSERVPIGMDRLFSLYHYSFQTGEQPRKLKWGNAEEMFYILTLRQKVLTSGFREMLIWVDRQWIVRKVEATTALEKKVVMQFDNIETGLDLKDSLFVFDKAKHRIRNTVQNPLIQP